MTVTLPPSTFARYRDAVVDMAEAGEPLGELEQAIDHADLADDQKAALWLVAYFNGPPPAQSAAGTR